MAWESALKPRAWVSELTFSDGSRLEFARNDIVLIVGPNNAGKSAALRAIRDKLDGIARHSPVVVDLAIASEGASADVVGWLASTARRHPESAPADPLFQAFGASVNSSQVASHWGNPVSLGPLARFFCQLLTAGERLQAANPANAIAVVRDPPSHPIHYLQRDDELEKRLSIRFHKAFGVDLVLHRNAGAQLPLHVGDRPVPTDGQDRVSYDYIVELEKLPTLYEQGDGMRSFAGVLLHTSVGNESILLIDEPEAFLHPPQARQLGRMLVDDKREERQLFVATHSGDVVRGVLDAGSTNVRVIRICRAGSANSVSELNNSKIVELWSDPLLRYSNILDGLFHERVVVCESDSDARFYAAVVDALFDNPAGSAEKTKPDLMFTHCGGKARLPVVISSLGKVGVPVLTITDFDVLNDESPLSGIVMAAGGKWSDMHSDWLCVKKAVDSKTAQLPASTIGSQIDGILKTVTGDSFPQDARRRIEKVLRQSSPWALAKTTGKSFIPNGTPMQAFDRLLTALRAIGVHVVEVGELEGFVRTVGNHGPQWVNDVLRRNLREDDELEPAREFVSRIVGE